jgi:hypothetical protein
MNHARRSVIVLAIGITLVATMGNMAVASKGVQRGPNRVNGTIRLVLLESTDGLPHYGQHVTFDVATTATAKPWVELDCYKGGVHVYQDRRGFFESSLTGQRFTLGTSDAWQNGDADCTAWLEKYTKRGWKHLASTSFHVYA